MKLGTSIGILLVANFALNAHAYKVFPPDRFSGTADNGIQIGCIRSGTDAFFKEPLFNCRFARGAMSLVVTDPGAPSNKYNCNIDSEGNLADCTPYEMGALLHMMFYIKTESVDTGLVACEKNYVSLGGWENLKCAASFNPEAGPRGVLEGWQTLANCLTGSGQRILLQKIDHDLKDGNWKNGDLALNAFDSVSRAYTVGGDSSDGVSRVHLFLRNDGGVAYCNESNCQRVKIKKVYRSFADREPEEQSVLVPQGLIFPQPLSSIRGTTVSGEFEGKKVECQISQDI